MKSVCLFSILAVLFISFSSFKNDEWKKVSEDPAYMHRAMKEVTDVIVHDIFSPPVASRIYAYVSVAGYEVAIAGDDRYISLASQLHGLTPVPKPAPGKDFSASLSALHAMLMVAKALVISEDRIQNLDSIIINDCEKKGMPKEVCANSVAYGKVVADHILAWAAEDNYKETRSLPKFTVKDDESSWKPTPPAYIKAIEPYWGMMRTFIIDSAKQFKPTPAPPFSKDSTSKFYKDAETVYQAGLALTDEQKEIANFWDCNPFKMNVSGHVMYATKKISPGGHWINITAVACKNAHADFERSAEAYACVAITLADAFISCWDEKYRSIVIRPETYINQYIDESWMPLLQTPPFPEYTSGHSVVSAASAIMLTKLFGDNFSYMDSTEVEFDLLPRNYTSFLQAAKEAAISRFYGGIHYLPAINYGFTEGEEIGKVVSNRLHTRK